MTTLDSDFAVVSHQGAPVVADIDAIVAFADAIGEDAAAYLSAGEAPPTFVAAAWVESVRTTLLDCLGPEVALTTVHLAQTVTFVRPVRVGATLTASATIKEAYGTGFGAALVVDLEVDDSAGLVTHGEQRVLVRGATGRRGRAEPPGERGGTWTRLGERHVDITDDQSIRYARASGDLHPIHLDEGVAKTAGFPRLVLHGMCTLAMCRRAVQDLAVTEPERVASIAVTFTRPVLVGGDLRVRVERGSESAVRFTAYQGGRAVTRGGRAQLR